MRLRIILAFLVALIYYTQDFRVYEGTRDQPMPGPFPAQPIFAIRILITKGRDPFKQTGKSGPLKIWTRFFETFSVGPNRSIEFWTEISENCG